jgi:hypothetical protein
MHNFSALFGKELLHVSDRFTVPHEDGNITSMTNTYFCEYSIKTPYDGQ